MRDPWIARLTGVLFIVATATDLIGATVRPSLAGPEYLAGMAAEPGRVAAGALLLLVAAFACAGIAIAMYPVLKRTDTGLALGSVVFRGLEAAMYMVAVVSLLSLATLSRGTVTSGGDAAAVGVVGGLLLGVREHAALAGVLAFCLGAFLYYVVMFRSRVVPRWLSGWGIVAIGLLATAAALALLADRPVTSYVFLALPIFLQEMVLAAWLIVRGFAPARAGTAGVDAEAAADATALRRASAPAAAR